jgi:hypothetical protein
VRARGGGAREIHLGLDASSPLPLLQAKGGVEQYHQGRRAWLGPRPGWYQGLF